MSFLAALKKAQTLHHVAKLVNYKPNKLSYLLYKLPPASKYNTFTIPKKYGGSRTIDAPIPQIKRLQRNLANGLLSCWDELRGATKGNQRLAHGFLRNRSIVTNAHLHRGRRFVFNVDLRDFFPSITFPRVRGFFIKSKDFGLPPGVATVLAQIVCHGNGLPQGAPSSPIVSNLVAHILDVRLSRLAKKNGCTYSRYADDLTFSTNLETFPDAIGHRLAPGGNVWIAGSELQQIVTASGFGINPKKTRMQYRDSRQLVTGLVVNRRISPPTGYRRLVRAMTHSLVTTGKAYQRELAPSPAGVMTYTQVTKSPAHLKGLFGFIDYIDTTVRRGRHPSGMDDAVPPLNSTEKTYRRLLMHLDFWATTTPTILCEGKTDNIYIRGAIRSLIAAHPKLATTGAKGKVSYKVRLYSYSRITRRILGLAGGSAHLKTFLEENYFPSVKSLNAKSHQGPLILLLDNDSGGKKLFSFIKGLSGATTVDGTKDFYYLKHNVYVVFTPIKKVGEKSCIEDFFDPKLKAIKLNGKTFNPVNDDLNTDTEYGKAIFATTIIRPNIATIDFKLFDPILSSVEAVIDDYATNHATGSSTPASALPVAAPAAGPTVSTQVPGSSQVGEPPISGT